MREKWTARKDGKPTKRRGILGLDAASLDLLGRPRTEHAMAMAGPACQARGDPALLAA